jgi:glycosyltransferase involved in cell wall biosynthesis
MRVAVWFEKLDALAGAQKHGLGLLEPLLGIHSIDLFARGTPVDPARFAERFGWSPDGVRFRTSRDITKWQVTRLTHDYDLFLNLTWKSLLPSRARKSLLLVYFPAQTSDQQSPVRFWRRCDQRLSAAQNRLIESLTGFDHTIMNGSLRCHLQAGTLSRRIRRMPLLVARKLLTLRNPDKYRLAKRALATYTVLAANSQYTAHWIGRYYGRRAQVCYPPIDVAHFMPLPKEKLVLTVGRIDKWKKQVELVRTFKELHDEGVLQDWNMVVCGGSTSAHQWLDLVQNEARGYPISVEVDVPFRRLCELYGRASLYWHAKGYGCDRELAPSRYEHFGMTTVEAMAAGCVPMVIDGGGQTEIVRHGTEGFLWETLEQLKDQVRRFVRFGPERVRELRSASRERADHFSRANFLRCVCDIYQQMGIAHRRDGVPAAQEKAC